MDGLDAASVGETVAAARPDTRSCQMTAISVAHMAASRHQAHRPVVRHHQPATAHRGDGPPAGRGGGDRRIPVRRAELRQLERNPHGRMSQDRGGSAGPGRGTIMRGGAGDQPRRGPDPQGWRRGHCRIRRVSTGQSATGRPGRGSCAAAVPARQGRTGYSSWVHLDDAASATVLAVEQKAGGVFSIVDDDPAPAGGGCLIWLRARGAKRRRCGAQVAGPAAGRRSGGDDDDRGRGCLNAKAKRGSSAGTALPSWRQGFKEGLKRPRPRSSRSCERAGARLDLPLIRPDRRRWSRAEVNGQPGAIFRDRDGKVLSILALDILEGQIQTIRTAINPDKLGTWVRWRTPGRWSPPAPL
jgi:hypothetical protein